MALMRHNCLIQGTAASTYIVTDSSDQTVTERQMDRRMDGLTNGLTDRRTDGRTNRQTETDISYYSQSGCQEAAFVFGLLSDINGLDEVHIQHPPLQEPDGL